MNSLSVGLDTPASKRARLAEVAPSSLEVDSPELGDDPAGALPQDMFFKPVLANPSKKKIVRAPIGTGGRLTHGQVLMTVHQRLPGFGDQ
eukprot:10563615-Alexandrium_andersonii.AAC.1